jgi:hypothetical protein
LSETNRFADTAGLKDKMCFLSFSFLSFLLRLFVLSFRVLALKMTYSLSLLLSRKKIDSSILVLVKFLVLFDLRQKTGLANGRNTKRQNDWTTVEE